MKLVFCTDVSGPNEMPDGIHGYMYQAASRHWKYFSVEISEGQQCSTSSSDSRDAGVGGIRKSFDSAINDGLETLIIRTYEVRKVVECIESYKGVFEFEIASKPPLAPRELT